MSLKQKLILKCIIGWLMASIIHFLSSEIIVKEIFKGYDNVILWLAVVITGLIIIALTTIFILIIEIKKIKKREVNLTKFLNENQISYKNNLQYFIDKLEFSFVKEIAFDVDTDLTFDKDLVPFRFQYCHSIRIITDKTAFDITTSMTNFGYETFWILPSKEIKDFSRCIIINSKLKNISLKNNADNFAFRIKLELENHYLFIYSGEIYETHNDSIVYKLNDEMLLLLDNEAAAEMFEKMVT
jgi:hypothetical protein